MKVCEWDWYDEWMGGKEVYNHCEKVAVTEVRVPFGKILVCDEHAEEARWKYGSS